MTSTQAANRKPLHRKPQAASAGTGGVNLSCRWWIGNCWHSGRFLHRRKDGGKERRSEGGRKEGFRRLHGPRSCAAVFNQLDVFFFFFFPTAAESAGIVGAPIAPTSSTTCCLTTSLACNLSACSHFSTHARTYCTSTFIPAYLHLCIQCRHTARIDGVHTAHTAHGIPR